MNGFLSFCASVAGVIVMSNKWIFGGAGLIVVMALGAIGTAQKARQLETDVQSLPQHAAGFLRDCRGAIRDKHAKAICTCMANNLHGALRTDDEYKLAGAIIVAITESGVNKSRMQAKFDQVSQKFHGRVSIDRKASVLRVVSTEGASCGKAHGA